MAINLMPLNYRRLLGDHRVRRRFILYGAASVAVIFLLSVLGRSSLKFRTAEFERLSKQIAVLDGQRAEALRIHNVADLVLQGIVEYQHMALPVEISTVIATAASLIPESVVLDSMTLAVDERQEKKSAVADLKAKAGKAAGDALPVIRTLRTELAGLAASDADIATFLDRLENHRLFTRVQMGHSRPRTVDGRSAREFSISFQVDLDIQYRPTTAQPLAEASQ